MIKYAIELEEGKFLENDKFVDPETNESPTVKDIENAVLFDTMEEAMYLNKFKKEDGYNSKIRPIKITFTVYE